MLNKPLLAAGRFITVGAWLLVSAFWVGQFFPGIEDPFPLSPARRAITRYSDWKAVGQDSATGQTIYEREGVVALELHRAVFTERKIGTDGMPDMWHNEIPVMPLRVGLGMLISFAILGLVTWLTRSALTKIYEDP
jgi:hypothetical protein